MLQIMHQEHRLRGSANVQLSHGARHVDSQMRPCVRDEIGVRLILGRRLTTESVKIVPRIREILGSMVTAHLVYSAPVGRPNVETLTGKAATFCIDAER